MNDIETYKKSMEKAIEYYREELKSVRTNRPSPSILDSIVVEVYGSEMRMRNVATVSVSDNNQLLVIPFDPKTAPAIAKAIERGNLHVTPLVDGNSVRVPFPPMSEERRKEIVKEVHDKGEKTKVSIRDVRRKAKEDIKKQKTNGEISEDEQKKREKWIQDWTDTHCKEVDTLFSAKQKEILEV